MVLAAAVSGDRDLIPSGALPNRHGRSRSIALPPIGQIPAEHPLESRDFGRENLRQVFSLPLRHRAFVDDDVSIFVPNSSQRLHTEEVENGIERFLLFVAKLLEFHQTYLGAWKKFEDPFELSRVESTIKVRKAPRFNRQRLGDSRRLLLERVKK